MAFSSDRPRKKARHTEGLENPVTWNDYTSTRPSTNERQDKILQSHIEREQALRAIVTCKICFRLLYEPFTNPCGHTYCYSCLCRWFANKGGGRKTCPDCRTPITSPPAPAFALREITRELLQRPELFPADDTGDHEQAQKEEEAAVEADRSNLHPTTGGLFGGCFQRLASSGARKPLLDLEDGVVRCPECAWELEDDHAYCNNCGYEIADGESNPHHIHNYDMMSTGIITEDELDEEVFPDDRDFSPTNNYRPTGVDSEASPSRTSSSSDDPFHSRDRPRFPSTPENVQLAGWTSDDGSFASTPDRQDYDDSREYLETQDDETSSMNDFLVDDDMEGDEEDSSSYESGSTTKEHKTSPTPRRLRYTIIDSDDEEDVERLQSDGSARREICSASNSQSPASEDSTDVSQSPRSSASPSADVSPA